MMKATAIAICCLSLFAAACGDEESDKNVTTTVEEFTAVEAVTGIGSSVCNDTSSEAASAAYRDLWTQWIAKGCLDTPLTQYPQCFSYNSCSQGGSNWFCEITEICHAGCRSDWNCNPGQMCFLGSCIGSTG
jgi:hypothetical protein